jgi:hypothetical protein
MSTLAKPMIWSYFLTGSPLAIGQDGPGPTEHDQPLAVDAARDCQPWDGVGDGVRPL